MSWHTARQFAVVFWLILSLLAAGGCSQRREKKNGAETLTLYGNVDIREVQLSFQDAGRILKLHVDEGANVHKGQIVAELDSVRYRLEAERLANDVIAQSRIVDRLHQGNRQQEIEKAKANVAAASANLREAELFLSRKQSLLLTNRISVQEVDSARAKMQTLQATLKSAEEDASLAVEGPRKEDIAAAEASLASLSAAKELAEQRLADTKLYAPADGIIRNRMLEPGAMAGVGVPVMTLALTSPIWVRAYISEPQLGKIKEGMRAQIYTDSRPDHVYKGWVGFIASTAEFTPKTVETTELRTKLVYRARIFACDPSQELRLGMPVTVTLNTAPEKDAQQDKCD